MRLLRVFLVVIVAVPILSAGADLAELARSARWREVLTATAARDPAVGLVPHDALVVAVAAESVGEDALEREVLPEAVGDDGPGQVARVKLAQLLPAGDAEMAANLVLPVLVEGHTRALRDAAADLLSELLAAGLPSEMVSRIGRAAARTSRRLQRQIDGALTVEPGTAGRRRASALLERATGDLPALAAAERLSTESELTARERWLVAKTLFRHGQYKRAEPLLESVAQGTRHGVPAWEATFLRGRCAFRAGRWEEAEAWFRHAIGRAPDSETEADLEVNLARTLELDGRLAEAIGAAARAVGRRPDDDRRLFLARLRLVNHQVAHAEAGLSRLHGRSARDRGRVLLALEALSRSQVERARALLDQVSRSPWRGPAAVIAAGLDADAGRWSECGRRLEGAAGELDGYWAGVARTVVARMPREAREPWLGQLERRAGGFDDTAGRRATATWAALEVDPERLARLHERVAAGIHLNVPVVAVPRLGGAAKALWELGLEDLAATWASEQFPTGTATEAAWSAARLAEAGAVSRAMAVADLAHRLAAPRLPERALPQPLRRALYPLPGADRVRKEAAAASVPWSLLAALVRAESRWDENALSAVGARGLTQMMPATAATVAARHGLEPPDPGDLFRSEIALALGARELGRLADRYRPLLAPAVAAYNAGEAQADLWLSQCGSGCTDARYLLGISFDATRAYTAAVLAGAEEYAALEPGPATALSE